jgi:hypothetical protein
LTERKLIQSIINRKGDCFHVNCDGGDNVPTHIGRVTLKPLEGFSNLGVPCPLREKCSNDTEEKDVLLMAEVYMKKLKKEKKNEN